uniref:Uncharacterized protein n=1 Tax=Aegilops tauschii subsp. strangulata TaxID=200361 RepID=A0A453AR37_AEGTS
MAAGGDLTDDERKALRGSKFAPLPAPPPSSRPNPRMAHPGGPLTTNKAAALAKFLERKLQQPDGLDSLNPDLVNLAVKNAKETIKNMTPKFERVDAICFRTMQSPVIDRARN